MFFYNYRNTGDFNKATDKRANSTGVLQFSKCVWKEDVTQN
jgi:hypothetical protein